MYGSYQANGFYDKVIENNTIIQYILERKVNLKITAPGINRKVLSDSDNYYTFALETAFMPFGA